MNMRFGRAFASARANVTLAANPPRRNRSARLILETVMGSTDFTTVAYEVSGLNRTDVSEGNETHPGRLARFASFVLFGRMDWNGWFGDTITHRGHHFPSAAHAFICAMFFRSRSC